MSNQEEHIKGTVLRPLADKFMEITRSSWKPATIEEAKAETERYIHQAYERLLPYTNHPINIGTHRVEFNYSPDLKTAHLFINTIHDPTLCPECIRPGTLTFGAQEDL